MKKLILLALLFLPLAAFSQTIDICNTFYCTASTSDSAYYKNCCVTVNDNQTAKLLLYDIPVEVEIYGKEYIQTSDLVGDVYYIDKTKKSYIFFSDYYEKMVCMVVIHATNADYSFVYVEDDMDDDDFDDFWYDYYYYEDYWY